MPESAHPNRWFGANPQATASQGKHPHGWTRDTPATWRSALGLGSVHEDREPPEGGGHWYPEPPKRKGPILIGVLVLAVVGIGIGWLIGNSTSSSSSNANLSATVNPTVAQGGHNFVVFACAACHGMQGKGGPDPSVPVLTTVGSNMSAAQLTNIITFGLGQQPVPAGQNTPNPVTGSAVPYMPTWKNILSKSQIADLVAYIQAGLPAIPGAAPLPVPTGQGDIVAGQALFTNYGCENCHGGNGLGGAVNPNNPGGPLPFLGGAAFDQQFPTPNDVISFIKSGSIVGKAPITSMPHWGSIIPPTQLMQLEKYIRTLPGAPQ
jgi:mono/diheme cytochrome c family protein